MKNDDVVFDSKSGISVEEQKEILSEINGIAEKNRRLLSQGDAKTDAGGSGDGVSRANPAVKPGKQRLNAKKSGAVFPVVVNAAAVAVLIGAGFILFSFNQKKDAQVRTGNAVYNLTERALIDEIRKDTADKLALKEKEIEAIASRLAAVDEELNMLYSGSQDLSSEQLSAQQRLLSMQTEYRTGLNALRDERSQILEDSRLRESRLRTLLDERAKEFSAAQQKSAVELDSARGELERMTNEQEKIAAIDSQLAGGIASVNALISAGNYAQASQPLNNLRALCNNNAYASARAFQTRKEFYNQSINSLETLVNEMQKLSGTGIVNEDAILASELQTKNSKLEETISDMQKTIETFSTGSSGQTRRISELETSVSSLTTANTTLRAANTTLETRSADKDRTISSLETERSTLNQTVTDLRTTNSSQEQEITNLRNQLAAIRQALAD
ncbi:MAG: hypothetical protein LBH16_10160 [Treponema sp.]|jgi:chromosome segregation ATPase|nr:hypothetical protein [Treponema sp.]